MTVIIDFIKFSLFQLGYGHCQCGVRLMTGWLFEDGKMVMQVIYGSTDTKRGAQYLFLGSCLPTECLIKLET